MKKIRIILLAFIILINSILFTGCFSYKEVDDLTIVAGVAIDKGIKEKFQITVEIVEVTGGKEIIMTSKMISAEGKTMFDAARNFIALSGKKLYWSHAKVIILSKEIATEGITEAIEWYNRDAETREDVQLLVSQGRSAKEIFEAQGITAGIKSFVLEDIIKNQENLSKAPITGLLKFNMESKTKGSSTVIPVVNLKQINGKMMLQVMGSAIIKKDKLVGFLNGEETKDLIFIRNEVKGGLLIEEKDASTRVSFEIFKSETKVTPIIAGKDIKINVDVNTTVAIDEINGVESFFDEEGQRKLEQSIQETLKERIELLIEKVQSQYDADILGFGSKLREDNVRMWNSVSNNWDEVFKTLKVNVETKVHIKNSAMLSKPSKEGD